MDEGPPSKGKRKGKFYGSVVATNVRRLIEHLNDGSQNAFAARVGMKQPTVHRIAEGVNDPTASRLQELVNNTPYEAWELLHPHFDPRVPAVRYDARAWRIASIYSAFTDDRGRRVLAATAEQVATDFPEPLQPPDPEQADEPATQPSPAPQPAR